MVQKLSGDNETNTRIDKSLSDDDIVIDFQKIMKENDKRKRNVRISRKENMIRNHFNHGFCKFRKQCKFLHICRHFISRYVCLTSVF